MTQPTRTLNYPDLPVDSILTSAARHWPHRDAVIAGDETLTFAQLAERANRFAAHLLTRGVRTGDVVCLCLGNTVEFPISYFGALMAGATICPTDPAQPPDVLRGQLTASGAVVLVTDRLDATSFATEKTLLVGGDVWSLANAGELPETRPEVAHLALTGGTTGASKLVRVLHRNALANILQTASWRTLSSPSVDDGRLVFQPTADTPRGPEIMGLGSERALAAAPFFHAHGLITFGFYVSIGATTVIAGQFKPDRFLDLVERHRITYTTGSPALWRAVVAKVGDRARDLSSVRFVGSGAAPIDRETVRELRVAFPSASVMESYGLTEATCAVTSAKAGAAGEGSVGMPLPDTEVTIRDIDEPAKTLETETDGEVWVRGPQVADGYHNDPVETAGQFTGGWLRTGDIGHLDDQGYLHLTGRLKDVILVKGYNVYPRELEELLTSHPLVLEAAVIGRPDGFAGEVPVAFVVLHDSASASDLDSISQHVAKTTAPYKHLREVRMISALPTSPAGKILKRVLREQDAQHSERQDEYV